MNARGIPHRAAHMWGIPGPVRGREVPTDPTPYLAGGGYGTPPPPTGPTQEVTPSLVDRQV